MKISRRKQSSAAMKAAIAAMNRNAITRDNSRFAVAPRNSATTTRLTSNPHVVLSVSARLMSLDLLGGVRMLGEAFDVPGAIDNTRQTVREHAESRAHGGKQEHRRDRELNDVGNPGNLVLGVHE